MEAVSFARILWVSGHTKRLTVNIWDLALEKEGKRVLNIFISVKSLSCKELCDSPFLNLAFSTVCARVRDF